jgi:hypothetical protein
MAPQSDEIGPGEQAESSVADGRLDWERPTLRRIEAGAAELGGGIPPDFGAQS